MNITADFDCPLMRSAGRLGRPKDGIDKRDALRLVTARQALTEAGDIDIAKARGIMAAIAAEVAAAPSHLAREVYPLAMQADAMLRRMIAARDTMFARIDQARAA
jgi:hypothetical protein